MTQYQINLDAKLLHQLFLGTANDSSMAPLLESVLNQVLQAQVKDQLSAEKYERTEERQGYRNGTYPHTLTTRVGSLVLRVPRIRNGEFSTELFARYQRSEQALVLALMEKVVNGVSTRKVTQITEELCGADFSKSTVSELCKKLDPIVTAWNNRPLHPTPFPFISVDAIYVKVREEGRVRSRGVMVGIGINEDGRREILGLMVGDTESETSWSEYFGWLKTRGLRGLELITSDQHSGLIRAVRHHFQGVTWQRCQTHFMKNIMDASPKAMKAEIKSRVRTIFDAPDPQVARQCLQDTLEAFQSRAPKAMETLERGFDDAIAVSVYPKEYRVRLRTTNGPERLNAEIRRREKVIGIFPNRESVIRLIGAYLMEYEENWTHGWRYFDMASFVEWRKTKPAAASNVIRIG